jgi:hypothetical protein
MRNLAPLIYRQTALVEWLCPANITAETASGYIAGLAGVLKMTLVEAPKTSLSPRFGESAWGHWEGADGDAPGVAPLRDRHDPAAANGHGELTESGIHFYAWDAGPLTGDPFGSAQIYTCRWFDVMTAVGFTREFFAATDIAWTEVSHGDSPSPAAWRPRAVR